MDYYKCLHLSKHSKSRRIRNKNKKYLNNWSDIEKTMLIFSRSKFVKDLKKLIQNTVSILNMYSNNNYDNERIEYYGNDKGCS